MKLILLFSFLFLTTAVTAQGNVQSLPPGTYETMAKNNQGKWERGDLVLLDDSHYRLSSSGEIGDYRFSITAQRIFFTSGPLKSLFARTSTERNKPVIILPVAENEQAGLKADVWCYLKQ